MWAGEGSAIGLAVAPNKKSPCLRRGSRCVSQPYRRVTRAALGPLSPASTSNSMRSPSLRLR